MKIKQRNNYKFIIAKSLHHLHSQVHDDEPIYIFGDFIIIYL